MLTALSPAPRDGRTGSPAHPLARPASATPSAVPSSGSRSDGSGSTPRRPSPRWRRTTSSSRPTLASPPVEVGALRDDADPAADFAAQKAFTPWTSAWNVTGMPAVSLPLHWTDDGLPVGVMLAARPAEEGVLSRSPRRSSRRTRTPGGWVDRARRGWWWSHG